MLSLSLNTVRVRSPIYHNKHNKSSNKSSRRIMITSATMKPSSQLYQPFRPPPSPLPPQFRNLDTNGRLEVLANRLGLWFEYAPLIPTLIQEGFAPPSLEEATGISGVEQNRLIVGAQVRDSLISSGTHSDIVAAFDLGGAELLYEIRLLSASQRSAAAGFIVSRSMDAKAARDLARAMKDFPRRKGDQAWDCFRYNLPGDCLAFMYFRQSREHQDSSDLRISNLEEALSAAESESARKRISDELNSKAPAEAASEEELNSRVPVVRLKMGEVAESSKVVVLPLARAVEGSKAVMKAPRECGTEGDFGIVAADKAWDRWVVLPGWEPLVSGLSAGVAVAFADARALPWTANRWYKEEPILVVADRKRTAVEADRGFYLAEEDGGTGLRVDKGSQLKAVGIKDCLGTVVLVVRPPRDEGDDDALSDEDWD